MSVERIDTLVVGGGQAGVAMSEHLGKAGVPHLVLERGRIAERWRSERWDSLVANGPAWHDRFPGMEFPGDPDAFVAKEQVAEYFAAYAEKLGAPIRCGVEVREVRRNAGLDGGYRPFEAHRQATRRRAKPRLRRLEANLRLRALVAELLAQRWSPAQIGRHLRARFPEDRSMWLCHEPIYQSVSTLLCKRHGSWVTGRG